jgi:hypothetical protein
MKFLIKITALVAGLLFSLNAEETERYGFLNVVNMIPSAATCEINLSGKNLVPGGLKAAAETGWFMVPIGSQAISFKHTAHKEFSSNITIVEGASNLIVIYLKSSERLDSDGNPFPPQVRLASIPAYESKGISLKAVSMLPAENHFHFAREAIELEFSKVTEIPKWTGGGFQIQHNGKFIGEVARGREQASYMVLLSTDHQGKHLTTIVNADSQKLPLWMQK